MACALEHHSYSIPTRAPKLASVFLQVNTLLLESDWSACVRLPCTFNCMSFFIGRIRHIGIRQLMGEGFGGARRGQEDSKLILKRFLKSELKIRRPDDQNVGTSRDCS